MLIGHCLFSCALEEFFEHDAYSLLPCAMTLLRFHETDLSGDVNADVIDSLNAI
jgi:hypothetical protein